MTDALFLIASFVPLVLGANLLVDNASSLAKHLNVPTMVIGLTIVAFGTSAPELIVNLFASFDGSSDIALGNVLGSNIFNVLFILGLSALIRPLEVKKATTWIEIPICLLSAAALMTFASDAALDRATDPFVGRADGIALLLFFAVFMAYTVSAMKSGGYEEEIGAKDRGLAVSILLVIAGLALLAVGGRLIVLFASNVARGLGIAERVIALTVVSIGTSLPELATSVVAARKGSVDIAIGNIVGSNIFNAFFILGVSAIIAPVRPAAGSFVDLSLNLGASLLLFLFVFTGKGRRIDRVEGGIFIAIYAAYAAWLILA
jgi:cation:H+ antiporter